MIRRKLTRIEVTLDDTKELDDLFLKAPQVGQLLPNNTNSTSIPKLSNLGQQKQLSVFGKKIELDTTIDTSTLDPNSLATNSNAANSTINTVVGDNQAPNQSSSNLNEAETPTIVHYYNPQPYNPTSSLFNQDN